MAVPKSKSLQQEDNQKPEKARIIKPEEKPVNEHEETVKIRPIKTCNDMVAVLRHKMESAIELPEETKYKSEGIVIGVGPGEASNGTRVPSQLKIGDNVMFLSKHIISEVNSSKPPYQGKSVVIISERSILAHLPQIPYQIIE